MLGNNIMKNTPLDQRTFSTPGLYFQYKTLMKSRDIIILLYIILKILTYHTLLCMILSIRHPSKFSLDYSNDISCLKSFESFPWTMTDFLP